MKIRLLIFLILLGSGVLSGQDCSVSFNIGDKREFCKNDEVFLWTVCSSCDSANLEYQWIPPSGTLPTGDTIKLMENGFYQLLITEVGNPQPCLDTFLNISLIELTAKAGIDTFLSCLNRSIILSGETKLVGPSGVQPEIRWNSIPVGGIQNGDITITPTVNSPGTYIMETSFNGCKVKDSLEVKSEIIEYDIDLQPESAKCTEHSGSIAISLNSNDNNDASFSIVVNGEQKATDVSLIDSHTLLGLASNSYEIKITDEKGCSGQNTATVDFVASDLKVEVGSTQILTCAKKTVEIVPDLSNPILSGFSWTRNGMPYPSNEINLTVTDSGFYKLEVEDIDGCIANDSVKVELNNTLPEADAGPDNKITCLNPTISLEGSNTSIGTIFIYEWSTDNGNFIAGTENSIKPQVDLVGTYTLIVTNTENGCESEPSSVFIDIDTIKPVAIASIKDDETINCRNNGVTLITDGSSEGNKYDYRWTHIDGQPSLNEKNPFVSKGGGWKLEITDKDNGCKRDTSIVVSNIIIDIEAQIDGPLILTCQDSSVILTGSSKPSNDSYLFEWEGPAINPVDTIKQEISQEGEYKLTVTDPTSGCSDITNVNVSSDSQRPTITINSVETITCEDNKTITLSATIEPNSGSFNSTWDGPGITNENDFNPVIDEKGTYTFAAKNIDNGCEAFKEISIAVDTISPDLSELKAVEALCEDQSKTFSFSFNDDENFIISWDNTTDRAIELFPDETYAVTVTNTNNKCVSEESITVESQKSPVEEDSLAIYLLYPDNLLFFPNTKYSFIWGREKENNEIDILQSFSNNSYFLVGNEFDTEQEKWDYFVDVFDKNAPNGCSERFYYTDSKDNREGFTSPEDEEQRIIYNEDYFNNLTQTLGKQDKINAYPNPTSGLFNIELYGDYRGAIEVVVYNEIGKRIIKDQLYKETPYLIRPIDFSKYRNGIYLIHLIDEQGGVSTIKTLVNH